MDESNLAFQCQEPSVSSRWNVSVQQRRTNSQTSASANFPADKNSAHSSRALATKPDVLVLDEPTVGVDAAATKALLEFIAQLQQERAPTILLVTHDLPLVRKHAQQVIWLYQGKVLHGPVAKLLTPERLAEIFETEIN